MQTRGALVWGERTSDLMPLVMPLGGAKPSSGEVRAVAVAHVCDQDDALDYARVCVSIQQLISRIKLQ